MLSSKWNGSYFCTISCICLQRFIDTITNKTNNYHSWGLLTFDNDILS